MVSVAIIATAFVAALKLHADSMDMLISGRIHTKAAELAQYKITEVDLAGLRNVQILSGDFEGLDPDYTWSIQVDSTPLEQWKKVTVSVRNKHVRGGEGFQLVQYMSAMSATGREPG